MPTSDKHLQQETELSPSNKVPWLVGGVSAAVLCPFLDFAFQWGASGLLIGGLGASAIGFFCGPSIEEWMRQRGVPATSLPSYWLSQVDWKRLTTPPQMLDADRPKATEENEQPTPHDAQPDEEPEVQDDFALLKQRNGKFEFSELLATGWRPSFKEIFLARLPDDTNVFVTVEQLVHIALSGATRNGKTSLIRQLLSQLIYVGCDCILLDPHFTAYDVDRDEDWTSFIPRLHFDPRECTSYARIGQIIAHADTNILAKRKARRARSEPVGKPIFIIIDEYPTVMANCPDIEPHIGNLLREAAKFQIYLCIASHDFLVKTAFPSMGSGLRDCLKTVIHVGGNLHTAKELLDIEKIDRAEEATLGKGRVYLRCETHKKAPLAQTPWMNDEAIHLLVGPSTYVPVVPEERHTEELAIPDDDKTTTAEVPAMAPNSHEMTDDDKTTLPSDWTMEEARIAKNLYYKERVSKEAIWKSMKKGTASTRRDELDQILGMEEVV